MSPAKPQTKSEIRQLLADAGVHPKRLRGQNFLVDGNTMLKVVEEAALTRSDLAFEVGAGTAGLTLLLADRAGEVLSVEVDSTLAAIARGVLHAARNVTLIEADVLAGKHEIAFEALDALKARCGLGLRPKLVANLPYSIATPLVVNLLLEDIPFERMVFTVQREVAERMVARPGTRDYGWVSVVVALSCSAELLRNIPPGAFWPPPRVQSSLVRLRPRPNWRHEQDIEALLAFGPYVFGQRRKTVGRILKNYIERAGARLSALAALERAGVPPKLRGDQLTPEQITRLSQTLRSEHTP